MPDSAADLLAQLVAIPSVNPDLVPGACGEAAVADFCQAWLAERGFEVHRLERQPGRPSVVGFARGVGGGRSLMLNGHIDTVTLGGYSGDPLAAERRNGRLYGRGAFDMKSGVAAMMIAAARANVVLPHVILLPAASMRMLPVAAGVNRVSRFGRALFLRPGYGLSRCRAQAGSTLATGHRRRRRAAGLSQASTAATSAGWAWV